MARAGSHTNRRFYVNIRRLVELPAVMIWNALFWTYERATWQYDLMVIAILSFIWLTPPDLLGDPTATGPGLIGLILNYIQ